MSDGYQNLPKFPGDVTDTSTSEAKEDSAPAESKWVAVRQAWPIYVVFACVFVALALAAIVLAVSGLPGMALIVGMAAFAGIIRMLVAGEITELWKVAFRRKRRE